MPKETITTAKPAPFKRANGKPLTAPPTPISKAQFGRLENQLADLAYAHDEHVQIMIREIRRLQNRIIDIEEKLGMD